MLDKAFFVSEQLHERPIKLPDGSTHKIHFREVTAGQVRAYQIALESQDESVRNNAIAVLISASVCEPDGSLALTYEQATKLKPAPSSRLLEAVLELNSVRAAEAKKPSPPGDPAGSGTSSPSPLAAARSRSSKRA